MTDLIAELAEVLQHADHAFEQDDDGLKIDAGFFAMDFIRTHHAEIEAMARDAARERWRKKNDNAHMLADDVVDEAIEAMHDSAREGGES